MGRPKHPELLTPAEQRVLDELRLGRTNAEIAARLGLSLNTVKYHVANMLAKLELPDRGALGEWTPSRARQGARWILGWPLFAGAGALAATAGAVLVGVIALQADRDSPANAVDPTPFATASPAGPTLTVIPPGPPVGRLAFVGSVSNPVETQLFVVPAAGGPEEELTSGPAARFSPVWSPEGGLIVYLEVPIWRLPVIADAHGDEEGAVASLRLVAPSTGEVTVLKQDSVSVRPAASVVERPSWRPDGQRLVAGVRNFITARVNADGSDYREELLGCYTPAWSSNGAIGACAVIITENSQGLPSITVFQSSGDFRFEVLVGDAYVSLPRKKFPGVGQVAHPVISASSEWLAWWDDTNARPVIRVAPFRLDGPNPGEPISVGNGMEPRWSPDGTRIVFSTNEDIVFPQRLARGDIVAYDVTTARATTVVAGGANRWPVWSPDGRHIAFVSDRDNPRGEVYVMKADGSEVTRVTFNERSESMLDWGR